MKCNQERKLIKEVPDCPWKLYQGVVGGCYFFIYSEGYWEAIQVPLFHYSKNFFQCRSVAIRMYDVFVVNWRVIHSKS